MIYPDYKIEQEYISKGFIDIFGMDEVARGNLAGPVYAAAVKIDPGMVNTFDGLLNDSKKVSAKKRRDMNGLIKATCIWSIGEASAEEIDKLNILQATQLAMYRAVSKHKHVDFVIVDGNMKFDDIFDNYESVVKGDSKSLSIAAASIIAKEHQCNMMVEFDKQYPGYDLAQNKGYGTKSHCEAIARLGPCPIHRRTFKRIKEYC